MWSFFTEFDTDNAEGSKELRNRRDIHCSERKKTSPGVSSANEILQHFERSLCPLSACISFSFSFLPQRVLEAGRESVRERRGEGARRRETIEKHFVNFMLIDDKALMLCIK